MKLGKKLLVILTALIMVLLCFASCDDTSANFGDENTGSDTNENRGNISEPDIDENDETNTAHAHTYGGWTIVTEPTCTTDGERTHSCDCGETENEAIDALGHDEISHEARSATCTEIGWGNMSPALAVTIRHAMKLPPQGII